MNRYHVQYSQHIVYQAASFEAETAAEAQNLYEAMFEEGHILPQHSSDPFWMIEEEARHA